MERDHQSAVAPGGPDGPVEETTLHKVSDLPSARPSSRLPGIDGLRAVAALWVVAFHIQAFSAGRTHLPGVDLIIRSGSTGVSLFLVLSGFCLYLPFAGGRQERFNTVQFFRRRCRRLMPAYYTSLAVVLIVYLTLGRRAGFNELSPSDAVRQVAAHAAMLHTIFPGTFYALNGAYWSLGLEWQLYLTLPILILGIRTWGMQRTLAMAVACNIAYNLALVAAEHRDLIAPRGSLAVFVLPNQLPGRWAEFILGMIAAELYRTGRIAPWASRARWMLPVLLPLAVVLSGLPLCHMIYGAVFFCVLSLVLAQENLVGRVSRWRPLVAIGTMSYSLYLVHQPIVQGLAFVLRTQAHVSPDRAMLALFAMLPVIIIAAWILFVAIERRTLTSSKGSQAGLAPAAAPVPATEDERPAAALAASSS